MMKTYEVICNLDMIHEIDAENEEQAKEIALELMVDLLNSNEIRAKDFAYDILGYYNDNGVI